MVTDYKPGVATGSATALPTMVIDPITGATVEASELSDHMRIQLMDPKWREQQARAAAKQKDTALAEGESIAASLKSLARKRGDIFGSAEVSLWGLTVFALSCLLGRGRGAAAAVVCSLVPVGLSLRGERDTHESEQRCLCC